MAINWRPNVELLKKLPKVGAIGALVAGGAVALPIAALSLRSRRRVAGGGDLPPPPPELTAPIPEVLEAPPPMAAAQTLMGQAPVEGEFSRRYLNQRAGRNAGPDTSTPNLTRPDGSNAINGALKVEELGAPARGI